MYYIKVSEKKHKKMVKSLPSGFFQIK